ncbi:MAG: sodium:proton antiporter [Rhizobacter sp.]|nr:sodium:proton antiporter [Chlorobiales bacterium]
MLFHPLPGIISTASATDIPLWALAPFALMLTAIAVLPLVHGKFWEANHNKLFVALALGLPAALYLIFTGNTAPLIHTVLFDYVPFMVMLGALFVITGGIAVTGDIEARPWVNMIFLGTGAVLASVMGTTGASMLLIRPLLQTNKSRTLKVHTVLFFIAIAANTGGMLTPLGDPPLFILYLRGVPFGWFFQLWPLWLCANFLLLAIYFAVDTYFYRKEPESAIKQDIEAITPIRISGWLNLVWAAGVVLAIAFLNAQTFPVLGANAAFGFIREAVIIGFAWLSLVLTNKEVREANRFSWHPVEEVAYLFFGIFVTMVPCLLYLEANAASLGVATATEFYYATGLLSGFLDNTPTAVTFYTLALAQGFAGNDLVAGVPPLILEAIAAGAVLFGGLTYIGNGPNFMVKAVAEEQGIEMPDFFAYMYKFSLIILLPLFILLQLLLIRG